MLLLLWRDSVSLRSLQADSSGRGIRLRRLAWGFWAIPRTSSRPPAGKSSRLRIVRSAFPQNDDGAVVASASSDASFESSRRKSGSPSTALRTSKLPHSQIRYGGRVSLSVGQRG